MSAAPFYLNWESRNFTCGYLYHEKEAPLDYSCMNRIEHFIQQILHVE